MLKAKDINKWLRCGLVFVVQSLTAATYVFSCSVCTIRCYCALKKVTFVAVVVLKVPFLITFNHYNSTGK